MSETWSESGKERLRWDDHKFEASLGHITSLRGQPELQSKLCHKKKKKKNKEFIDFDNQLLRMVEVGIPLGTPEARSLPGDMRLVSMFSLLLQVEGHLLPLSARHWWKPAFLSRSSRVGYSLALLSMVPYLSKVMVEAVWGRLWEMWLQLGHVTGGISIPVELAGIQLVYLG